MPRVIHSSLQSQMIKLTALLLVILGLSSCGGNEQDKVIDGALSSFTYKADVVNEWQHPIVTDRTLTGDCEDLTFWIRDLLIAKGVDTSEIQVLEGNLSGEGHMLIRYKGEFIDTHGRHDFYPEFVITRFWQPARLDIILAALEGNI